MTNKEDDKLKEPALELQGVDYEILHKIIDIINKHTVNTPLIENVDAYMALEILRSIEDLRKRK